VPYVFLSVIQQEIKHSMQPALFASYLGFDQMVNTDSPSAADPDGAVDINK